MGLVFLLLFIGLPVAEIMVMSRVSALLGFWDTLFLIIFSALIGVHFAKMQGAVVMQKMQQCLAEGRMPAAEMFNGMLIFLGGVLFIIPGFITDGLGLLLIFPPTRWCIKWLVSRNVAANFTTRRAAGGFEGFQANNPSSSQRKPVSRDKPVARGPVEDAEIVE